jgi:MFS family permease
MTIAPYRQVLALPGMRLLTLVGMLAKIPATAAALTVTLHVVNTLGLKFTQAGLAGSLAMAGAGLGAPLAGRMVDRFGLRPVLAVTTIAQGVYWSAAPHLPYVTLIIAAFFAGGLNIPIFSVMRQFMAAMTPLEHRRTAFALDSMAVELSYMAGPALAVAAVTSLGSVVTMYLVGVGLVLAGVALMVMNPPVRSAAEQEAAQAVAVPRRQWLRPSLIALLVASAAATMVLTTTELSVVATLNAADATAWTGLVIAVWCIYSLVGGFVYGALHRSLSPLALIGGLALLTAPLALVGGPWWMLCFALIPCGMFCAPSLAATVDTLSQWVPPSARGEAVGLHGTALTCGIAVGAPFGGRIIDAFGPHWGFFAAGAAGVVVVLLAIPFWQRTPVAVPEVA